MHFRCVALINLTQLWRDYYFKSDRSLFQTRLSCTRELAWLTNADVEVVSSYVQCESAGSPRSKKLTLSLQVRQVSIEKKKKKRERPKYSINVISIDSDPSCHRHRVKYISNLLYITTSEAKYNRLEYLLSSHLYVLKRADVYIPVERSLDRQ